MRPTLDLPKRWDDIIMINVFTFEMFNMYIKPHINYFVSLSINVVLLNYYVLFKERKH